MQAMQTTMRMSETPSLTWGVRDIAQNHNQPKAQPERVVGQQRLGQLACMLPVSRQRCLWRHRESGGRRWSSLSRLDSSTHVRGAA